VRVSYVTSADRDTITHVYVKGIGQHTVTCTCNGATLRADERWI
jgi:hypothetical protein